MTLAFDFHPEAQAEFAADVDWYDAREAGVGGRFAEAVRAAVDAAVDDPAPWATWSGWRASRSCVRRAWATNTDGHLVPSGVGRDSM
jgi:hypothetical protein